MTFSFLARSVLSSLVLLIVSFNVVQAQQTVTIGTYSFDSKSSTQGNSIVVLYGVSTEGGTLTTYWGPNADTEIVSMGSGQYEVVETLGGRCLTSAPVVTINQCTGAANQLFTFTQQADLSYKIQLAYATTSCLTSPGAF